MANEWIKIQFDLAKIDRFVKILILQWGLLTTGLPNLAFYHSLCLKGKPWSCGHPVGGSLPTGIEKWNVSRLTIL